MSRRLSTPTLMGLGVAVVAAIVAPAWREGRPSVVSVPIGIISPLQGPLAEVGRMHQETVKRAFRDLGGGRFYAGDQEIVLEEHYEDDRGDPRHCASVARRLVDDDKVALILGPVSSDCAKGLLEADLSVPIISGQATASALTDQRAPSPWFFRATMNDRQRLAHYLDVIRDRDEGGATQAVALFDDRTAYGRGLADDLSRLLPGSGLLQISWEGLVSQAGSGRPSVSTENVEAVVGLLPEESSHVFILGNNRRAVALARAFDQAAGERRFNFYLVGWSPDFRDEAPPSALTAGEPYLDAVLMSRASDGPGDRGMLDLLRQDSDGRRLLVPIYEVARFVVPQALGRALREAGSPDRPDAFRDAVAKALSEPSGFDSLTPPRRIQFRHGELLDPLRPPIFSRRRSLEVVNRVPDSRWVRIGVEREVGFLESPVTVRVVGHHMNDDEEVDLIFSRSTGLVRQVEHRGRVRLQRGEGTYTFDPTWPGRFTVRAGNVPSFPTDPIVEVGFTGYYLVAATMALIGVLFARTSSGGGAGRMICAEGILAGLLAAFVTSYLRSTPLTSGFPIPSFSEMPFVNAVLSGLAGGWYGPGLVASIFGARRGGATA